MAKRRHKKKKIRVILLLMIILLIGIAFYFFIFNDSKVKVKKYDYELNSNATPLMEENFRLLKEELGKESIDYKKYAEYLTKIFIADLYTLDNKENKYDVSSCEYIYPSDKDNFKNNVQDTIYKYIVAKEKRKEELSIVKSIEIENIDEDEYTYNNKKYDAYKLMVKWEYKKNMGYDSKATIYLIKDEKKLYVASLSPEVENEQD